MIGRLGIFARGESGDNYSQVNISGFAGQVYGNNEDNPGIADLDVGAGGYVGNLIWDGYPDRGQEVNVRGRVDNALENGPLTNSSVIFVEGDGAIGRRVEY